MIEKQSNEQNPVPSRLMLALIIAVAVAGSWLAYRYFVAREAGGQASLVAGKPDGGLEENTITVEEERLAYLVSSIEVAELAVGPDTKPGDDGGEVKVGGLLRVSGNVINKGGRGIMTAMIVLNPQDASGNVIGSYVEELLHGKRLAPGESRAFRFIIPEKPEYAGRFLHKLR